MDAATLLRSLRQQARLTLRELADRAGTSHATLSAYEAGRVVPSVETLDRIARAAGFHLTADATPAIGGPEPAARGRELVEVLELAAMFPARHAARLHFPPFGS